MYLRLYESMLAWYSKWYPRGWYRHFVTALALTLLMAFNILSILNLLGIFGSRSAITVLMNNGSVALSFLAALTCFHFFFAVWRSTAMERYHTRSVVSGSKRVAVYYMLTSIAIFLSSSIALAVMWPRI
jgi:hypothetical protein